MAVTLTAQSSLTIDQWAELMGVPPLEFNNLDVYNCISEYDSDICSQFWSHWQYNASAYFSREQLAGFIQSAESQIESYLGYFVAPKWTYNETHRFKDAFNTYNGRYKDISEYRFTSNWKNVIAAGIPKLTTIEDAAELSYSDEDGDGFAELASVTVVNEGIVDLVLNYPNRFRFFVEGHNGEDAYEIRHALSVEVDQENYTMTATFNSWELIKPELYLPKGFAAKRALNACDPNIFIQQFEVAFEEVDTCKPNAQLIWYGNPDICADDTCIEATQPACINFVDKCDGIFKVRPVTVDDDGCVDQSLNAYCTLTRYPDAVKVNYISGCHNRRLFNNPPLLEIGPCPELLKAILALSATYIGNFSCACGCIQKQIEYFNTDLGEGGSTGGYRYPVTMLQNPFGSAKRGAVEAFRVLENLQGISDLCYKAW